ncbi:MAG: CcmD family protein [Bacteroidota bacterium]|nr:CcmD family protein [Bacteroidota bacterium]
MVNSFLKRCCFTALLTLPGLFLFAQTADSTGASMDTVMRSNDKIYVVMAVCLTILVVLFLYLIRIDRKVSKKEKTF